MSSRRRHRVWQENDALKGFISVMDSRFVGRFRRPASDPPRYRALLDEVKQHYDWLSRGLSENVRAVNFYHAQGFRIEDCAWQDDTQHPTDYALAGGSNALSASAGPSYFPAMPAPYSRRNRCPDARSEYLSSARSPRRFAYSGIGVDIRPRAFMQANHPGRIPSVTTAPAST